MAYTLDDFYTDSRAFLKAQPLDLALQRIADCLARLIANPAFVFETFNDDMPLGKRVLHHDPELDFYVLAQVQPGGKNGKPHSHGAALSKRGASQESIAGVLGVTQLRLDLAPQRRRQLAGPTPCRLSRA
jgi:hypothetical protein